MLRFGLCCKFEDGQPAARKTTIHMQNKLNTRDRLPRLYRLIHYNLSEYLPRALHRCASLGIYNFRVTANMFPCMTHDEHGFAFERMPRVLFDWMRYNRQLSRSLGVRMTIHHNHFIVPGSAREDVASRSLYEINEIAKFCSLTGIDTMILHCAGTGEKEDMKDRLVARISTLSDEVRSYIGFENDHNKCTPRDAHDVATRTGCRFVYDVHHHRLNSDGLTIREATDMCIATHHDHEPLMHISSPRNGWGARNEHAHSDYINIADFPEYWLGFIDPNTRLITIEVETKKRESALVQLIREIYTTKDNHNVQHTNNDAQ